MENIVPQLKNHSNLSNNTNININKRICLVRVKKIILWRFDRQIMLFCGYTLGAIYGHTNLFSKDTILRLIHIYRRVYFYNVLI